MTPVEFIEERRPHFPPSPPPPLTDPRPPLDLPKPPGRVHVFHCDRPTCECGELTRVLDPPAVNNDVAPWLFAVRVS